MEFIETTASRSPGCTYAISGSTLMHQAVYICETCNDGSTNNNSCCCAGCASSCHEGHDVSFMTYGNAYCDCGQSKCSLMTESMVSASELLAINKGTISFDSDNSGRVAGTAASGVNIPPFSIHEMKNVTELSQSLQEQCEALAALSKDTFWLGINDTPRCPLEELAMLVFTHHVPTSATINAENSGVEWWVQVKSAIGDQSSSSTSRGIDLHYDKDEEIASSFSLGIFPQISTVTYLSEASEAPPTIVLETTSASAVESSIHRCFVSIPEVGKHVAFDGQFLHGAPSQLGTFTKTNGKPVTANANNRVTFLVNIWLNHHPAGVKLAPIEILQKLPQQKAVDSSTLQLTCCEAVTESSALTEEISARKLPSANYVIEKFSIPEKVTTNDDVGDWELIPFVSDKSEWGKADDETGLVLSIWIPTSIAALRQAISNDSNSSLSSVSSSTTFLFHYSNDRAAARLQYEEEEEEEELYRMEVEKLAVTGNNEEGEDSEWEDMEDEED